MPDRDAANSARERLLEAALQLFSDHGIDGTTTRAIAHLADVNEVTLFRHFGSKDGLVRAVIERFVPGTALPRLDQVPLSGDIESDLFALTMTLIEFHEERHDFFRFAFANLVQHRDQSAFIDSVQQQMLGWWTRFFQTRSHAGIAPDALAFAFVAPLIVRTIRRVFTAGHVPDAVTFARQHAQILARAAGHAAAD